MSPDSRLLAGRYQLGELVGRGGMSDVHRGTDTRLGRTVAIKLLKPSLATDPAFRTRFRQEAQAAARMAHPTIVRVFDAGEETVHEPNGHEAQLPFIVMEFVDGILLKDLIKKGPLEVSEAVRITEGILTALEYSHRAGVVHRDIKPGNVMITKTGQVKVMDFGIARAISDSSATVAQTTAVLGTASYFSPEQAKGESVDARTDLYSTGVVLFEMLAGRPPFRGDTPVAVAYQHVSETPVAPSTLNPKVSPAMDVVVARALTKDRFERYQTVAEFRADLEEAAAGRVPVHKETDEFAETLFGAPPSSVSGPEAAFRQLAEDQTMTRTQRRPPVIWIWAGIAVMAVVIVAVLAWVLRLAPTTTMPETSRTVPSLSGQTVDQATAALEKMKLKWTQTTETSSTYPEGQIIRSDPGAGIVVATGDTINLFVSTGKKTVSVPDVHNMTLDAAKAAITAAGLTVGPVTSENSSSVAANIVISTDPTSPGNAHEGDPVSLTISSGKVTLSDLTGQTIQAATGILSQLGLTANPKPDSSCPQDTGAPLVHSQSVAPGDVPQGSTVDLTYCSG
ncbi:putative serine/threonine-protein kinase PknB [Leifsonia sp. LS1]|uniref:Stk1 family PASTA domain-containing Ser/Thr kinase n=1 Tax=unclassified Leifsonia TaxID=2663824 RepID=UPI001CBC85A4|nr:MULTISPECIES: Stk1 family PASTA domain-containing Ser/Thr kinase [unclassified Leifsonia]UAJ79559.1 Stk1 family PASTA domain-containing Ser/Thr kinase [Leifsonia sp. ZF2019]GIT78427.1 putative serine/threonine-protein kinase PknB [Leifsonia sp. LS1]